MKTISRSASVAVVVPIYRRRLHADERQSLRHVQAYLGGYDRYLVAPEGLRPRRPGFEVVAFPAGCFESVETYSRLLLSAAFYRAFSRYRYILICQLDSLVLADALEPWCAAGFDYLGAPWLKDPAAPEKGFSRVGNGGFSLRRVESCLRVLEAETPSAVACLRAPLPDLPPYRVVKRARVIREARRGVGGYCRRYSLNEDHFWSDRARLFWPGFRVAPVETALKFAFERAPRYCLARNGGELPFGCHAWTRWGRAFWEPHLIAGEPA